MRKKVQHTIHTHNLIADNGKIIIGVSGGPDSMSLLHILQYIAQKKNLILVIAHVLYGIRTQDAIDDQNLVQEYAQQHNIKFILKDLSQQSPSNHTEDTMRKQRYDFFEKIRKIEHADTIAIGHTQNDLVETFFLHLIRGSGMRGLSALAYKRKSIIRPLLDITRNEVLNYCQKNNIPFHIDKTNTNQKYLRNRIRHTLLPLLAKDFNPKIYSIIAHTTHNISKDYQFLQEYTQQHIIKHTILNNTLTFSVQDFRQLHPSLQHTILHTFASTISKKNQSPLSFSHCRQIQGIITSTKNKTHLLRLRTLILQRNGDKVKLMLRNK